ncbi:hypothetical protein F441_13791 [Phytophthora nicotianae CJ01A1]|uniref:PX domain-containing protein n=6 Tax=Phytophthora nicotianae TaxID=4792 RepID=W2PWJ1_PHYN3|nr:hypothetical protein PPTG_14072 [Phytophthora nicotianae INRA-310]ETI40855.1 hypothetical protein F443_13861 [Phytophthora nicotianae P1569]ETK80940.1 hypothetical protein L915_13504 [Phytophthora nicotianae]ETO69531.1 hypothetical protein F444_13895 [Phytophthora nicotianae P1976]ETP10622.1 hypothetical protein F441_13791 [Phytophthora nicotianae CJ01A1]ETP38776.1 hypothetical protein F442_13698 [Phytophthora nicotianae P10297]KUF76624.1 hypothetical protein AM587_10014302 [Phytophthora n
MFATARQQSPAPSALPESVAWLEHLTLEMTSTINTRHGLGKRNVQYELHMIYQTSKNETTSWTLSRSFDEYRDLRRRLVKALRLGHRCNAECKWLGNVIKHHFPRASLFCRSCPTGVEGTRVALLRMLNTVKASLVNHGNLGCSRMRDDVSKVFTLFVSCNSTSKHSSIVHSSTASTTSSLSLSPSNFERSSTSASLTSDEEIQEVALEFDDFPCGNFSRCECGACRSSLH